MSAISSFRIGRKLEKLIVSARPPTPIGLGGLPNNHPGCGMGLGFLPRATLGHLKRRGTMGRFTGRVLTPFSLLAFLSANLCGIAKAWGSFPGSRFPDKGVGSGQRSAMLIAAPNEVLGDGACPPHEARSLLHDIAGLRRSGRAVHARLPLRYSDLLRRGDHSQNEWLDTQ